MRLAPVVVSLAMLVGCRSQGTPDPGQVPLAGSAQRQRLVYEIDLAKAIDDRHRALGRDVEEALRDKMIRSSARVSSDGVVITLEDAAKKAEVEALLKAEYEDQIELIACPELCIRLSTTTTAAIKKAALQSAVTTIRHRLDALKVTEPSVTTRGEQIVIEVGAGEERIRAAIARSGKLEFKVAEHASTFMHGVYALAETDPRARELAIVAEIDQWQLDDSRWNTVDYYLLAPERATLETYFAEIAKRDPRYQLPDDRQLGYERLPPGKDGKTLWRSYFLERTAELTGADVANVTGMVDPNTNTPIVLLDFNRAGARILADVTARNVGRKLATLLDDQIRSAPIINGTINGGRVSITMGAGDPRTQEAERDQLVNALRTGSLPAPLREVQSKNIE